MATSAHTPATLVAQVTRFVRGLDAQPAWRARLAHLGYTDQVHRELRACLARALRLDAPPARSAGEPSLGATARAVAGWTGDQLSLAAGAVGKLPTVTAEAIRLVTSAIGDPSRSVRGSFLFLRRLGSDRHLGRWLTWSGHRDAAEDLRLRLRVAAAGEPPEAASGPLRELAFLWARWRHLALRAFQGQPEALEALGLG